MKQFFRLFAVVGIVLLAALISAITCGKTAGNNNGGNGNNDVPPSLTVTITDTSVAKKDSDGDIFLKASAFPTTEAGADNVGMDTVNAAADTTRKAAFSLGFDGSTGGLTIVDKGSRFPADMSLPASAALAATDTDGVKVTTLATAAGTTPAGMNIVSIFASQTAPADAAEASSSLGPPFAFSAAANTQPIFWCVSTIPGITTAATATSTLAGGQKADCYVASVGTTALGGAANATAWLTATGNIKRRVTISVLGIKTGAKTIPNIGLSGANDAAKVAAFNDGISGAEIRSIGDAAGDSGIAFSQHGIKVVSDTDFDAVQ